MKTLLTFDPTNNNRNKMRYSTWFSACSDLMEETQETPIKITVAGKRYTAIIFGNGTYKIIK